MHAFGFRWQSLTDGINKRKKDKKVEDSRGVSSGSRIPTRHNDGLVSFLPKLRQNRSERRQRQERERDLLHQGTAGEWRVMASQVNEPSVIPSGHRRTRNIKEQLVGRRYASNRKHTDANTERQTRNIVVHRGVARSTMKLFRKLQTSANN